MNAPSMPELFQIVQQLCTASERAVDCLLRMETDNMLNDEPAVSNEEYHSMVIDLCRAAAIVRRRLPA